MALPLSLTHDYCSGMLGRSLLTLFATVLFMASAPLDSFTESRAEHGAPTEQQHSGDHTKNAPCIGVCGCHAGCLVHAGMVRAEGPTPVEVPLPRPEITPRSISLEISVPPPRR